MRLRQRDTDGAYLYTCPFGFRSEGGGCLALFAIGNSHLLLRLDPDTGHTVSSLPIVRADNGNIVQVLGLAREPATNTLWAVLNEASSDRFLARPDPSTGIATTIGSTGLNPP
jgi:hypothetical protein